MSGAQILRVDSKDRTDPTLGERASLAAVGVVPDEGFDFFFCLEIAPLLLPKSLGNTMVETLKQATMTLTFTLYPPALAPL